MLRTLFTAALAAAPALGAAAPAPGWGVYADCAAAYRANARIKDPSRPASMASMISDQSDDYLKTALQRYREQTKAAGGKADAVVKDYVARKAAVFDREPRARLDRFLDSCPQTAG